ncbi:MAG: 2-amino-4-oxopentanoate thiolase subunit OrtA [Candidatus Izemoplasmatales bacterium]|nr:2-amino-4-oxopentanoate thiolase subunit OrtA [Candidatus Izemoplasmatales bacterium]MDD3865054.1 2-amino-4-oxopentanoate thiolase subunit OrtA [Candidatus Izemoplasmatales bacterium]
MILKNSWVQIHKILLKPEERTGSLPPDTKQVPFEMWDKGFLTKNANIGDEVEVITITGRSVEGTLIAVNPSFMHNYGTFVPEILIIDKMVKTFLFGGDDQ